ncbi:hypothetical protein Tco_0050366 [Tanacetum coccineum]
MKDMAIGDLRKKLEKAQKEKDAIQLNVEKLENAFKRNCMPPKSNLSFNGLEEFANKPIVEAKSSDEKPKAVRKKDDALIIEDWVSDDEEKDESLPKIGKKIVRPSIVKKEFVKSKQEKTARKTIKNVEHPRKNTHRPRGTQRN